LGETQSSYRYFKWRVLEAQIFDHHSQIASRYFANLAICCLEYHLAVWINTFNTRFRSRSPGKTQEIIGIGYPAQLVELSDCVLGILQMRYYIRCQYAHVIINEPLWHVNNRRSSMGTENRYIKFERKITKSSTVISKF